MSKHRSDHRSARPMVDVAVVHDAIPTRVDVDMAKLAVVHTPGWKAYCCARLLGHNTQKAMLQDILAVARATLNSEGEYVAAKVVHMPLVNHLYDKDTCTPEKRSALLAIHAPAQKPQAESLPAVMDPPVEICEQIA